MEQKKVDNEELLCCPFCGRTALIVGDSLYGYAVKCSYCDCVIGEDYVCGDFRHEFRSRQEAAAAWNTRYNKENIKTVHYFYTDTEGLNQLNIISSEEAGDMLTELYNKLNAFRKATADLYNNNFSG